MEFSWLNKQGVSSNRGFDVQMINRNCIEYREKGRKLSVDVEMGMSGGTPCLLVSPGSFTRWDDEPQTLATEEQVRIEDNFRRALAFQKVKVVAE